MVDEEGTLIKKEEKLKELPTEKTEKKLSFAEKVFGKGKPKEQPQLPKESKPKAPTFKEKIIGKSDYKKEQPANTKTKEPTFTEKAFGKPGNKKEPSRVDNNKEKGRQLARAAYTAEREKQAVKYGKERARIETRTRLKKYKKEPASEKPHAPTQQPHPLQPMLTPSTIPNLHTPRLATGRMSWPQPEQRSENLFTPPNIHTSQLTIRTPHFQHPQKSEKHPTRKKKTTMSQKQQHINIFKPSKLFR